MLAAIIRFFLENKLVVWLLLLCFVGWGLATAPFNWDSVGFLPRDPVAVDAIPDIGENQQIVFTPWPGQCLALHVQDEVANTVGADIRCIDHDSNLSNRASFSLVASLNV